MWHGGSGRIDYLCMQPNGATTACIRDKEGWTNAGDVTGGVAHDRADCHWADADGKLPPIRA